MTESKIELFFLKNLLQIALLGVSIILTSDIILTFDDVQSVTIDFIILAAALTSFALLKLKLFKASVVVITALPLATMFYQALTFEDSTIPFTVFIVIGFAFSILLKGKLMWFMHILTVAGILSIFFVQAQHPEAFMKESVNDVITIGITFMVLYTLVCLSAATLKSRYDRVNHELKSANDELQEKSTEIEAQNEELLQSQDKLYSLNQFLEQSVEERTKRIIQQSEQLLKYAYVNAHHVRGPVARVLGLLNLSKIDTTVDYKFLFEKIEHETQEIDSIISRINTELEKAGDHNNS